MKPLDKIELNFGPSVYQDRPAARFEPEPDMLINIPSDGKLKKNSASNAYPPREEVALLPFVLTPQKTARKFPAFVFDLSYSTNPDDDIENEIYILWIDERHEWVSIEYHRWRETALADDESYSGPYELDKYCARLLMGAFFLDVDDVGQLDIKKMSPNELAKRSIEAAETKQKAALDLSNRHITALPPEILHAKSLEIFNCSDNPILEPPPEIVAQGLDSIRGYFRSQLTDRRTLNEAKLLLVGDGSVGKTSLAKSFLGEIFDAHEPVTKGISINYWKVENGKDTILTRIWDFGGQEIMHATHQFFLSARSLYILVLDGRKDEDPEYWLKYIQTFGGNSRVLVVLNKIDENPSFEVNNSFLRKKYPSILDFYRVSCANGLGLKSLRDALISALKNVEMVQSSWGGTWLEVKQRIEVENHDYISHERFQSICQARNVAEEDQVILLRYLHDLGLILHFSDFGLSGVQVLNPKWATNAVYRIINSETLTDSHGVLALDRLSEILKKRKADDLVYPPDKYPFIIGLMKKFELCYEVDNQHILVPDLLAVDEPKYTLPNDNLLTFRFEYDFLPRSIMPRFIVKQHHDIMNQLRWRTGVVLEDPILRAQAEVKCDVRDRFITVSVAGDQRRAYFSIIRKAFRDIHDSFTNFKPREKIPLPDYPNFLVEYNELVGLERMGVPQIVVGKLGKRYSVEHLLSGIETKQERTQRFKRAAEYGQVIYAPNAHIDQREDRSMTKTVTIGNGATFHGDFVVADVIQHSFNKLQQSNGIDGELKRLLLDLTQALAPVAEALPEKEAKRLTKNLDRLTDEATSEDPDPKWWQVSLDGIIDAAKDVGAVGLTALELAAKVAPLIG